jgi:hypothetical protein
MKKQATMLDSDRMIVEREVEVCWWWLRSECATFSPRATSGIVCLPGVGEVALQRPLDPLET